jgi:hypothetical protein
MNTTDIHNERIAKMTFFSVYPLYLAKVEKKGRTKEELHQVINWLTGFDNKKLKELIEKKQLLKHSFRRLR